MYTKIIRYSVFHLLKMVTLPLVDMGYACVPPRCLIKRLVPGAGNAVSRCLQLLALLEVASDTETSAQLSSHPSRNVSHPITHWSR